MQPGIGTGRQRGRQAELDGKREIESGLHESAISSYQRG